FRSPVKIGADDPGAVSVGGAVCMAPAALSGNGAGVGIQKNFCAVEAKPLLFIKRAVQAVRIFKFFDIQSEYNHGIDKTDPVIVRKLQHCEGFLRFSVKQEKFAGDSAVRLYGKVDSAGNNGGS